MAVSVSKKRKAVSKKTAENEDVLAGVEVFMDLPPSLQNLWIAFIKSSKVVMETIDRELREKGLLSLAEYEIVASVNLAGGRIRFIDLAKVTLLSQSRISRQINALQAKKILVREMTDTDRRATFAIITKQGSKVLALTEAAILKGQKTHFYGRIPPAKWPVMQELLEGLLEPGYRDQTVQIINAARKVNGKRSIEGPSEA